MINPPTVALIFYNRPDTTRRVMAAIRAWRPETLHLIADHWPEGDDAAREICLSLREEVEKTIDWSCDLRRHYAEEHLGCRFRPATGISTVFEHEESAILLEDDCLPDPSFFDFCAEMLERYKNDESVMMVAGSNRLAHRPPDNASYFFSRYPQIWGWATWRRAWNRYDISLTDWPEFRDRLGETGLLPAVRKVYRQKLDEIVFEGLDAWDFGWSMTVARHGGKVVVPARNLVANIGFGRGATHTLNPAGSWTQPAVHPLPPPYPEPVNLGVDDTHDRRYAHKMFASPWLSLRERLHRGMRKRKGC